MKNDSLVEPKQQVNSYIIIIIWGLLISYLPFFLLPDDWMIWLASEDGIYEYTGSILFFITCFLCCHIYFLTKNLWFILLSLFFLVVGGEEISWGQRLIGFETPDFMMERNVQREFNLHNIEIFNMHDFGYGKKIGLSKLLTANFLFKLICVVYGFVLPLLILFFDPVRRIAEKIKFPVPVFSMGVFLLLNWVVYYLIKYALVVPGKDQQINATFSEVFETCAAFVFFILVFYFKKTAGNPTISNTELTLST